MIPRATAVVAARRSTGNAAGASQCGYFLSARFPVVSFILGFSCLLVLACTIHIPRPMTCTPEYV
jgi:hypothetical protein